MDHEPISMEPFPVTHGLDVDPPSPDLDLEDVLDSLKATPGIMEAVLDEGRTTLRVTYDLHKIRLYHIERILSELGMNLRQGLLCNLWRNYVHYEEQSEEADMFYRRHGFDSDHYTFFPRFLGF